MRGAGGRCEPGAFAIVGAWLAREEAGVLACVALAGDNPGLCCPMSAMNTPALCPACGARNDCTLADPRTATQPCWCFTACIDPAVIEALPPALRNQACLCPRCAQAIALPQATPANIP